MARFYVDCKQFFLPTMPVSDWLSNHFKALRLRDGEIITLFNGQGQTAQAELKIQTDGRKTHYNLLLQSIANIPPSHLPSITLWQAVLPPDRMDYLIEKSTEIGFSRIVPIITSRTNIRPTGEQAIKKQNHWQKVMISSCEQCGRDFFMSIETPKELNQLIGQPPPFLQKSSQLRLLLTIPELERIAQPLLTLLKKTPNPQDIILAVGPEGGFTTEEIQSLQKVGFESQTFGTTILRSETAGIVAGCSLLAALGYY